VVPASLSALPPMRRSAADEGEASRLDLARWIASAENPLTARVAVNHVWARLFGTGLVSTPDDFGATGEAPSHPELLDWLASEFARIGWSRKQLIRLLVTSSTYRQGSAVRQPYHDADPLNRLLSRQNRIRLDAEILRDSALAVSGLLTPRIGGPSFRPPLPEDLFDVGRSKNWQAGTGAEIFRRSLYIITLRSVLYPLLTTFDGPDAADACVNRERSNTPLQALAMMNDGVFLESARALALRVLRESADAGETEAARLGRIFSVVLNRAPRKDEMERLVEFHRAQMKRVRDAGDAALEVLGEARSGLPGRQAQEAATLTATARVLMNLDEFINRE
jgi:hypothetical protein